MKESTKEGLAIFAVVMVAALVMLGIGISGLRSKNPRTLKVQGSLSNVSCAYLAAATNSSMTGQVPCNATVTYTVGSQQYSTPISYMISQSADGKTLAVYCDPSNPSNVSPDAPSSAKTLSVALTVVGGVLLVGDVYMLYKGSRS